MTALAYLWARHRVALIAFGLALVVTLVFSVRLVANWIYWSDPAHRDVQIEGWMTPGYVAHSYRVPPEVIRDALPPRPAVEEKGRRTLSRIARETGTDMDQMTRDILQAITVERARDD